MTASDSFEWTTSKARAAVRALMPVEADLAFRRRCETVVEFLNAGPEARILDCGCGYGFLLRVLVETTHAQFVGLDLDQSRLNHVREHQPDQCHVSLMVGNAQSLPFATGEFTHVVCSEVLEHLDDDQAAVAELCRVLQPGGVAAITVPSAEYPITWDPPNFLLERLTGRSLRGERPWSGIWYGHRRLYRPAQLRRLLEEAGFEVEEERSLTHSCPPFAHLLLYGLLKPLLVRGLLPRRLSGVGDRFRSPEAPISAPVRLAMRVLERIDRPNDDPQQAEHVRTFVALAIKGRKPM